MKLEHAPPRVLLGLWPVIDAVLYRVHCIHAVTGDPDALLRVEHRTHASSATILADGVSVHKGQALLEIHLAASWFRRRRAVSWRAGDITREILVRVAADLGHLALRLGGGAYPDVVAMHGVTFLDAGARRLGFEVRDLPPGRRHALTAFYMAGLMDMSHLTGSRAAGSKRRPLREIWMSREYLVRTYGSQTAGQTSDTQLPTYSPATHMLNSSGTVTSW